MVEPRSHGQSVPAPRAPRRQDATPAGGAHPRAKSMVSLPPPVMRLVSTLH